jgi:hypothetical protein
LEILKKEHGENYQLIILTLSNITIMMKHSFIVAVLLLVFGAHASNTLACSCMMPGTPLESLEQSSAVFAGTVSSVEPSSDLNIKVTFAVTESWKGATTTPLVISTGKDSAMCGFNFEQGKTYLVYAYDNEDGGLSAGLCSRTHEIVPNDEDIAALGTPTKPNEVPITVPKNRSTFVITAIIAAVLGYSSARYVKNKRTLENK